MPTLTQQSANVVNPQPNGQPANRSIRLPSEPASPSHRLLRGYAFDPSMATQLETALVSEIMYKVPWENLPNEEGLPKGPIGEYVEIVDYDPATGCFYAPVNLEDPRVLAQNGLAPSEGNPQFHQQMVYAVVMTTIDRFERALGRKAFWADRIPKKDKTDTNDRFVQRLRIYPHALRMANAYYSRNKRALLFGYFPGTEDPTSGQFPGGMVFTCLSHDVITHETTHALLDGFNEYFMESTNEDVLAFHEAFADIVALFQHFTFPSVLAHQIAKTRGDLHSENLLAQLASQVGHARGAHGALRDAIGKYDDEKKKWIQHEPDPTELERTKQVHARGAILVAAVFDAFISIYKDRSRDLVRLASGGTGVIPEGDLHPDLVNRLAQEACKSASHVLNMCLRALDYCPPVDITFGEYLRALITADMDLMSDDTHRYRVAFIEAFRRRGIFPKGVRTLSEDSLRWARPGEDPTKQPGEMEMKLKDFIEGIELRSNVDKLRHLRTRREIWQETRAIREELHKKIRDHETKAQVLQELTGLALDPDAPAVNVKTKAGSPVFSVQSVRESRRERGDGRVLNQVFITLLQKEIRKRKVDGKVEEYTIRCGSVLVLDLDEQRVSYVISKPRNDEKRFSDTIEFQESRSTDSLHATYFGAQNEPFAALHSMGA